MKKQNQKLENIIKQKTICDKRGRHMKSEEILYKKTGNDEAYTPKYGVIPILKYIKKGHIVWCPFDKEDSHFVQEIKKTNKVVFSHIDDGKDFFEWQPYEWDVIVSNPPFKGKRLFFERALCFGKPFALIMTNAALNDKYPSWCWKEHNKEFQMLKFDKRIKFNNPYGIPNNKITFSSSYFCCDFLPDNLIQEEITI